MKILIAHFGKFDFGFLLHRGLDISGLVLRDTWIISSMKSNGVYTSNKLKEIARTKLGVETGTETDKDNAMAALGTKDYGDVDYKIMSPYANDDCRLAMLLFFHEEKLNAKELACHDLYIRNTLHVIKAESRGICLNLAVLKAALDLIEKLMAEDRVKIKDLMGAAEIDINDTQAMLKYLHQKNLHPPPRDYMGQLQFVIDREYLWGSSHPLAEAYATFDRRRAFQKNFSALNGVMLPRVFANPNGEVGFHVQHLLSVFSRGGLPLCKLPNFDGETYLDNDVRAMFAPRKNHDFVVIKAVDLPALLLAFYSGNAPLQAVIRQGRLLPALVEALGLKKEETDAVSVLLRQQIEGSGVATLEQRMGYLNMKFKGKKTLYALIDKFTAAFGGLKELRARLEQALAANGSVEDRLGRVIKIDANKYFRAHSILVNSSYGSIISQYLDMFCRLGETQGASLVMAHDKEMVFEAPAGDTKFAEAAKALAQVRIVEPAPVWEIKQGQTWNNTSLDSHETATRRM